MAAHRVGGAPQPYRIFHPEPFVAEGWNRPRIFVDPDYPGDLAAATYREICAGEAPAFEDRANPELEALHWIYEAHQNGVEEITGKPSKNPPRTRSLSVGDVIELHHPQGYRGFVVAALGFIAVHRKLQDSAEIRFQTFAR